MASERRTCKSSTCHRRFSRPLGSRREFCEECRPPRNRNQDAPAAPVLAGPGAPGWSPGRIESRALAELTAAGRAETLEGEIVVRLAREMDSGRVAGSALTSLAKQLLDAKSRAMVGIKPPDRDRVDDLADRRADKAATA